MVSQSINSTSPMSVDLFSMATCAAMGELSVLSAMANSNNNQEARTAIHCKYPSKRCWNHRVEKRNGEMHKFCEYHRQKANSNQRRMEQRRKQMRTVQFNGEPLQINTNPINHAKHALVSSPCSVDHASLNYQPYRSKRDMCMDVPFSPCDMVEFDVGLDAAINCMMIDNEIEMEPSDLPVNLYEADLFFLEHFMTEITKSTV